MTCGWKATIAGILMFSCGLPSMGIAEVGDGALPTEKYSSLKELRQPRFKASKETNSNEMVGLATQERARKALPS